MMGEGDQPSVTPEDRVRQLEQQAKTDEEALQKMLLAYKGAEADLEKMKTEIKARIAENEKLAAEGDAPPTLAKSAGSLADMDDASFKLLMWKRLGQNDFDRIFKGPRVEFEI